MSRKNPATWLTNVLGPEGFARGGKAWTRSKDGLVDVVTAQVSKAGGEVTVNTGVCDPEIYRACWGRPLSTSINEANCTVRARAGQLVDGHDRWWRLDDPDAPQAMRIIVRDYVLPFIERMHSGDAMEQYLLDTGVVSQHYPPPIIYLALLKHRRGIVDEACILLQDLEKQTTGPWHKRVRDVAKDLNCF
jgi:hypothetical protein